MELIKNNILYIWKGKGENCLYLCQQVSCSSCQRVESEGQMLQLQWGFFQRTSLSEVNFRGPADVRLIFLGLNRKNGIKFQNELNQPKKHFFIYLAECTNAPRIDPYIVREILPCIKKMYHVIICDPYMLII